MEGAHEAEQQAKDHQRDMDLTPAQASGKRKRSLSITAKSAVDSPSDRKKAKEAAASVRAGCTSSSPPSLQNLPVELLESIFLYSMNLALPRSSPLIGAKLSAKATRLQVFIMGFDDFWSQCFGIPKKDLHRMLWMKKEKLKGDDALQSALLCSPWVHIDLILEAQQAWADKYAAGRCYQHYKDTWYDDWRIWLDLEDDAWDDNYDARYTYRLHALQHEQGSWKFNSRACFEADYERARQLPPKPERFSPDRIWGTSDTLIDIRMPIDLITGPWDEEKTRRLFWMRRAGVGLTTDPPSHLAYSSEVKLACLDAAVICAENPDPLIINCLIGPWIFIDLPEDDKQKRRVQLCNRIERGSDSPTIMCVLQDILKDMDRSRSELLCRHKEVHRELFYMTYPGEPGDDMDPYERWYGDGD
ncbi:hypothetical protein E4U17_001726 [Claviceps sp. LM77 group G4]|nr:hypothetical protein E4U17_001726 [Claviceps sp. LM77 group G4]KAG6065209.1 hypothetical protein E4U33_005932 [Claviceps sp. LM78 group G4]